MATNLLWFVMAGFLLGFATSTLWEWFYFRKERLKLTDRRIRELEAKLRDADVDLDSNRDTNRATVAGSNRSDLDDTSGSRDRPRTRAWGEPAYRSPGVFLESEEFEDAEFEVEVQDDEGFGPERAIPERTSPPTVPTVDSIVPKATAPQTTSSQSTASKSSVLPSASSAPTSAAPSSATSPTQSTQSAAASGASAPDIPRVVEFASPADALRAKRGTGPRSRQEVLAALRRNSEAVQRGESPGPIVPASRDDDPIDAEAASDDEAEAAASDDSSSEMPAAEVRSAPSKAARPSTLVSPNAPDDPTEEEAAPKQSPARQRWANDRKLTARSQEYPDDLSKIRGIGDVYKQRLYRAGIYTWKQIVEADSETLRRATSAYPSSNVEEWVTQAEKLMEKHGRKQAVYSGPQPDDMTKILGIGPVSAAALYRAGICTYEQLASLPIADLEALFPIAVAGDMPDFEQWVARAANLADEKHS